MAKDKLNEASYASGAGIQSKVAQIGGGSKADTLTSMYGWKPSKSNDRGVDFVRVDVTNQITRERNARNPKGFGLSGSPLAQRLDDLFDTWLTDNTHHFNDVKERNKRLNELYFMFLNDPFIKRVVDLVADESTNLLSQDRLIEVETPDPKCTERIYQLLAQWGVTHQKSRGVCFDLELYGEAVWANKITDKGVERIIPLKVTELSERLEFNPIKASELLRNRRGFQDVLNRDKKLQMLLDAIDDPAFSQDYADMFDTKLFGYALGGDLVVPPWTITHFRFNAEHSEFYPYGRPHLLGAITPFKQATSTITLQNLARIMSFPVTLYKVKTLPGQDEGDIWELVNSVREEYENIGVTPQGGQAEVYSVNTKVWAPEGLLDIDVKAAKADIDFVGDLELYQDRVAVASGIPKGYLVQEWGGWGNSAVSLVEQFKPFARHVHSIQSAYVEGLSELIRLHFAISGEYPFDTPFTLSMRFPAEEMAEESRQAKNSSLDLSKNVLETLSATLGVEEGEPLPDDVVKDILSKYSFLDPTDIIKWSDKIRSQQLLSGAGKEGSDGGSGGGGDFGGGSGGGGGGLGPSDFEAESGDFDFGDEGEGDVGEEEPAEEPAVAEESVRRMLKSRNARLRALREDRLREISRRYSEAKDDIYMNILENNSLTEFNKNGRHYRLFTRGNMAHQHLKVLETLAKDETNYENRPKTLRETFAKMRETFTQEQDDLAQPEFDFRDTLLPGKPKENDI
jgi:uncharacterized membrane protein YgcG